MPYATEAFGTLGETSVLDGRAIAAADVRDADLLAVRSTTRVDRALLEGSRVRFVGTATIGTDHLDIPWLEQQGICWSYAPGCNANSVSEYVSVALLCLAARHGIRLQDKTLGVVGVGHVGSRVVEKARALGLQVRVNDPPRQRAGESHHRTGGAREESFPFVTLEQLCREADIVTFHVPLIHEGPDRTRGLADTGFFERLKPGAILINSARGAVVQGAALMAAMDADIVRHAALDTWEGEPDYSRSLLERVDIGTPHIAGHSFEGKAMGTVMVYREACRFLGQAPAWSPEGQWPEPVVPRRRVDADGRRDEAVLWELARAVYNIEADDQALRGGTAAPVQGDRPAHAVHFDHLRRHYPVRREFRFTRVELVRASAQLAQRVRDLGFTLASA